MKKKISISLIFCLLFNVCTVFAYQDEGIANNYDNFLNTSKDRRISKDAVKHMWHSFWEYIGVYKNDNNDNEHNRNNSYEYSKNNYGNNSSRYGIDITADSNNLNSTINSIVSNKEGTVYYIQNNKLKISNNTMQTLNTIPNNLIYTKVVYNHNDDSVYVAGHDNSKNYIYEIYPKTNLRTCINYSKNMNANILNSDFIEFDKNNNIWFSDRNNNISNLEYSSKNNQTKVMGTCAWSKNKHTTFPKLYGTSSAVVRSKDIFVLNNKNKKLYKIYKNPRRIIEVAEFKQHLDCSCSYNNNFYAAEGNKVYVINLNGKVTRTFILTNDNNMIITAMNVDGNNNLIVNETDKFNYYSNKSYIKKIKL